jgi:hypothetical protein
MPDPSSNGPVDSTFRTFIALIGSLLEEERAEAFRRAAQAAYDATEGLDEVEEPAAFEAALVRLRASVERAILGSTTGRG